MRAWLDLLSVPVRTPPPVRSGGQGLRGRGMVGDILGLLADGEWRTTDEIAEAVSKPRNQVASNLVRLRERGDVASKSSARPPAHPKANKRFLLVWGLP